ncbi:hypothetical protein [Clostridium botulinum]
MKMNLGYVTKYGSSTWASSTILGIIKNEKYKGDLLLGKTFTVDPISKLDKEIESIEGKKSKLVDMRLEDTIDKASYEVKYSSFTEKQEQLLKEREKLQETAADEKDIKRRLRDFKKTLEQNKVLSEFHRYVFESIVEKVIVGGYDEDGNKDPAQLTFVYKTGLKNNVDGSGFKPQRKNARGKHRNAKLCSNDKNEVQSLHSHSSSDTCRECCEDREEIDFLDSLFIDFFDV